VDRSPEMRRMEDVRWRFTRRGPIRLSHYNRGYRKFNNGIRWFRVYVFGHDIGGLHWKVGRRGPRLLGPGNRIWYRQ
jgi:hypothetical protein